MKYLDVLVVISPAKDGAFEVNVASSAGGEGNSILRLPFVMRDLSGVMFNVRSADRGFHPGGDGGSVPNGTASSFGVQLFEALFQGETREVLSRTESEAKRQADTGVRIRLSMNLAAEGMAEVASLPWELMRRRDQSPLVVSVQTPVVRAFDTPKPIFLQPLTGKLRILALVSNPRGTAALNLQEERDRISKIWESLDNVEVDFVRPVEAEVLNHLAGHNYHVVHFMGHGDFDSGSGGLLALERDDGSAHLVNGDTFAAWLQDEPLRLIFLNACNTGTTGEHLGLHPFAGVASALIRSGVPAVVAMQFPISDNAAIIFAQTFYERIAQSFPVDAAVSDGRKRLLSSDGAEWATPVLYMRATDGNLFDQTKPGVTPRKRVAKAAVAAVAAPEPERVAAPAVPPVEPPPVPPATTAPAAAIGPTAMASAAEPAAAAPIRALVGDVPPAAKPWFKRPFLLAGIPLVLLAAIVIMNETGGTTKGSETTVATSETAETADAAPSTAMETINAEAEALEQKGGQANFAAAMKLFRQTADQGDAYGQYSLGFMYDYGEGVAEDDGQAADWYRKAAEQGYGEAQNSLGQMYEEGTGVEKDIHQAVSWYRKAAEQENATAQFNLGRAYETGEGVPVDLAQARTLYRQAKNNPGVDDETSKQAAEALAQIDATAP